MNCLKNFYSQGVEKFMKLKRSFCKIRRNSQQYRNICFIINKSHVCKSSLILELFWIIICIGMLFCCSSNLSLTRYYELRYIIMLKLLSPLQSTKLQNCTYKESNVVINLKFSLRISLHSYQRLECQIERVSTMSRRIEVRVLWELFPYVPYVAK